MVEPCKEYYERPEEGKLTGYGEGDDGSSSRERFRKPTLNKQTNKRHAIYHSHCIEGILT